MEVPHRLEVLNVMDYSPVAATITGDVLELPLAN